MNDEDTCPECAAFFAEMKAAITGQFGTRPPRSREQVQQAVERYLSLPDEAVARLQESFAMTKAARVYARFIGTSHKHRLR
jgi:hypothetical protein